MLSQFIRYRPCAVALAGLAAFGLSSCTFLSGSASDPAVITKRFQSQLESLRISDGFPGATAAFILPDDTTVSIASGLSDLENEVAMTEDMLQPIGRAEELFVSTIALSLEHEDLIDLDTRLYKYFETEHDDKWLLELPNAKRLTLRHLLTHSSGLVDDSSEEDLRLSMDDDEVSAVDSNWNEGDVQFAVDEESEFEPGQGFDPVQANYRFARMVLEQTSELNYSDLLQDRILDTFQLNHTAPLSRSDVSMLSMGYHGLEDGVAPPERIFVQERLKQGTEKSSFNDALYSNPEDLVRWAKLLFEENALAKPYMESLFASGYRGSDRDSEFGLGVYIYETTAGEAYGYSGTTRGHETAIIYFPRYRVGVCIQVNRYYDNDIRHYVEKLAQVVLNAIAG